MQLKKGDTLICKKDDDIYYINKVDGNNYYMLITNIFNNGI